MVSIPESYNDITPEWLNSVLKLDNSINNSKISKVKIVPLKEQGIYGQLARIYLTFSDKNTFIPSQLIIKLSSLDIKMRTRKNTMLSYQREIGFYRNTNINGFDIIPAHYYSDIDKETGWHVLILKDLYPAKSGIILKGCNEFEACNAIKSITTFHKYWIERGKRQDYNWLIKTPESTVEENNDIHNRLWDSFISKAGAKLTINTKRLGEQFGKFKHLLEERLFKTDFNTLLHFDYHLENILFDDRSSSVFIIDWQFTRFGLGVWDIAYFISQNLDINIRRNIEISILDKYYKEVYKNCDDQYTFSMFLNDYKMALFYRYGQLIWTIAGIPFSKEKLELHVDVILVRLLAALDDNDCISLLNGY